MKPKYINVSPDGPSLPNRVKLLLKSEFVTQIIFSKINRFHPYSVEFKHSENTYPCLLNFTVEQTDIYSWVETLALITAKPLNLKNNKKAVHFIT